jgi:hypothetical protein
MFATWHERLEVTLEANQRVVSMVRGSCILSCERVRVRQRSGRESAERALKESWLCDVPKRVWSRVCAVCLLIAAYELRPCDVSGGK